MTDWWKSISWTDDQSGCPVALKNDYNHTYMWHIRVDVDICGSKNGNGINRTTRGSDLHPKIEENCGILLCYQWIIETISKQCRTLPSIASMYALSKIFTYRMQFQCQPAVCVSEHPNLGGRKQGWHRTTWCCAVVEVGCSQNLGDGDFSVFPVGDGLWMTTANKTLSTISTFKSHKGK